MLFGYNLFLHAFDDKGNIAFQFEHYPLRLGFYQARPFKMISLTQTTLRRAEANDKGQAVMIANVGCSTLTGLARHD